MIYVCKVFPMLAVLFNHYITQIDFILLPGSVKWFGPNELFLCNCANDMCLDDGQCEGGVKCKDGFFGYACQYNDASLKSKDTDAFMINIHTSKVRFIQIVFRETAGIENIFFQFEVDSIYVECAGNVIKTSHNVIEYHCSQTLISTRVIVSGSAIRNVCSVYVSRGRNMLLKPAFKAETMFAVLDVSLSTDGVPSASDCTILTPAKKHATAQFILNVPARLNTIIVIFGSVGEDNGVKVELRCSDVEGQIIWSDKLSPIESKTVRSFHVSWAGEVAVISIWFSRSWEGMILCELLAYGDCSTNCGGNGACGIESGDCSEGCKTGYWGSQCLENCSATCGGNGACGIESGECSEGCKTGYCGSKCLENCSATCGGNGACGIESGECNNGCKTGYWGSKCLQKCSEHCDGDRSCLMESGVCTHGCKPGLKGKDCSEYCSFNCGGNGRCSINNGHCTDGCKPRYYGLTCSESCSALCDNDGSCYLNGTCTYGCQTGYFGSKCTKRRLIVNALNVGGLPSADGNWTCHCAEGNCSDDHNMCPTGQCVKGWFGYSCQYIDVGIYARMTHPDLNDNNDLTCYTSHNNTVTAHWEEEFEVSWVRLVFTAKVPSNKDVEIEVMSLRDYKTLESKMTFTLIRNLNVHRINTEAQMSTLIEIDFLVGETSICEVELVGECSISRYGLHCLGICRFTCHRNRCTYDGRCFDCVLGRSGPHCETSDFDDSSKNEPRNESSKSDVMKPKDDQTTVKTPLFTILAFVGLSFLAIQFRRKKSKPEPSECNLISHAIHVEQTLEPSEYNLISHAIPVVQTLEPSEYNLISHAIPVVQTLEPKPSECNLISHAIHVEQTLEPSEYNLISHAIPVVQTLEPSECNLISHAIPVVQTLEPTSAIKWVGPNKLFLCNCVNDKCRDDGQCERGVRCKGGFFGYACQYNDASYHKNQSFPELMDNDDGSCMRIKDMYSVFVEILTTGINFVRVVLNERADVENLNFGFMFGNELTKCDSSVITSGNNVIEYHCAQVLIATLVIIRGALVGNICSVYVSYGRNMLMKATFRANATLYSKVDMGLTDGIMSGDCSFLLPTQANATAFFTLSVPARIDTIIVHLGKVGIDNGVQVELRCSDADGRVIWRDQLSPIESNTVRPFHVSWAGEVAVVSIWFSRFRDEINICELLAYGDCVDGKYGLTCDMSCNRRCKSCTVDGHCIQCHSDSYEGVDYCSSTCGGNSKCDRSSGHCIEGCITGYLGPQCLESCSQYCDGDKSCNSDGSCTNGCIAGYYGYECLSKCSDNCDGDGSCLIESGVCVHGCKRGFVGKNCSQGGLQSADGQWTCHCAEGNCSEDHNMCPTRQCVEGWFGYSCQYIDAGTYAQMTHSDLNDNNDSTCYTSDNNTVTAHWEEEFEVSWVRLVFEAN
ncbi:hypothetical protein Btru_075746, partial [Bulinus truncatus]